MIRSLSLYGLRGFADEQTIEFAVPSAESCGLTIIVGSNNTGKSTIFEGIKIFSSAPHMVGEAVRSSVTNQEIRLAIETSTGRRVALSNPDGGAQLRFDIDEAPSIISQEAKVLPVPSRRIINSQYGIGSAQNIGSAFDSFLDITRHKKGHSLDSALATIARDEGKKTQLNALIAEIAGTSFNWTTEINSANNEYFKFRFATGDHSLEGLGEGVISLLVMLLPFVEQRYPIITIDEPELSLHPAWQKRLFTKLVEFSQTTQIIIATHSPHFVDIGLTNNGARIYRTYSVTFSNHRYC